MEGSKTEIKELERGLINPHQGRVYLRAALAQDDEQVLLGALHEIIDSLIYFALDDNAAVTPLTLEVSPPE